MDQPKTDAEQALLNRLRGMAPGYVSLAQGPHETDWTLYGPAIASVGLCHLADVREHHLWESWGGWRTNLVRFHNGGFLHYSYGPDGRIDILLSSRVRAQADEQGGLLFGLSPLPFGPTPGTPLKATLRSVDDDWEPLPRTIFGTSKDAETDELNIHCLQNMHVTVKQLRQVGVKSLSDVQQHHIHMVAGSCSHVLQLRGAGQLQFAHRDNGEILQTTGNHLQVNLTTQGQCLVQVRGG